MNHELDQELEPMSPEPRSGRSGCFKAGVIGCGVLIVLLVVLGIFAYIYWRTWVGDYFQKAGTAGVQASALPADQKPRVIAQIQRLAKGFKDEDISLEQITQIGKEVGSSPLMRVFGAYSIGRYVPPSDLSDPEKQQADVTLQRFASGLDDGKITEEQYDEITRSIRTNKDVSLPTEQSISTDKLRKVLAGAKKAADDAGIPESPPQVDVAKQLEAAIDKVLEAKK